MVSQSKKWTAIKRIVEDKTDSCAYFIKDVTRQTEVVKYGELF